MRAFCPVVRSRNEMKSQRAVIAAQPNCCGYERDRKEESNPKSRGAQVSSRREGLERDAMMRLEIEGRRREPQQAVFEHGAEIRSVKRNFFEESDGEQR